MLQKLQNIRKKESGFTIIEVMIVLAVAGLIMVIVLVAVPQLQRNQRNSARRDVAGRIKSEIDAFAGNNNGNIPSEGNDATNGISGGFTSRYLAGVDYKNPSTGNSYTFAAATPTADGMSYRLNTKCSGESYVAAGGNRTYSLIVLLEGGALYCVDNSD